MYIFLEKKPNCLQTVVTQIRCRVQRRLIWVCTVCQLPFRGIQNTMGKWEPWWYSRKYKLSDKNTCITIISWLGAKFGFISEIQRIPQQFLMFILLEIFIWGSGDHKRSPRWQKNSILLSIQHHSERRSFAWRFILNENILFWLTSSDQKPFVFSVSVFYSQIFILKLNLW